MIAWKTFAPWLLTLATYESWRRLLEACTSLPLSQARQCALAPHRAVQRGGDLPNEMIIEMINMVTMNKVLRMMKVMKTMKRMKIMNTVKMIKMMKMTKMMK